MLIRDWQGWPPGALHLAVGVFDGVHRGHQALVRHLREDAQSAGARPVAATFDPLPIEVLAPHAPPSALTDAEERVTLLRSAGAAAVVVFTFDQTFAAMSAREFVERILGAGEVRRIVVGGDFRFGRGREGDVGALSALAGERGASVEVVDAVVARGEAVSSTRIRNVLLAGDVRGASELLGRPHAVPGRVAHGDRRGRALGYPTINVATPRQRLLPRDGIYATWVEMGATRYAAASSLGVRPTFGGTERLLESYLLDFSGEVYGESVRVAFVERIARDVEATRRALG